MKKQLSIFVLAIALTMGLSCSKDSSTISSSSGEAGTGTGGSMARFTITGNTLFTVSDKSLTAYDISTLSDPKLLSSTDVGTNIETIFPRGNNVFIGSQLGMYIYDVSSPSNPVLLSQYNHVFSCDPVVANNDYAFVTLRSSSMAGRCFRAVNQLDIIDIKDLQNIFPVRSYQMTNPRGLGVDANNLLFVCDAGIKVYDASDVMNLKLKNHFTNVTANDVIPLGNRLLVVADQGFFQYAYQQDSITFLSKITIDK